MVRAVVIIILVATAIGALMPSKPGAPSLPAGNSGPIGVSAPQASKDYSATDSGTGGVVTLERNWDGHFYADAQVNGATIRFLVDTGASGVALARDDAQRAGIAYSPGSFGVIGQGASGEVRGQPVRVERLRLGDAEAQQQPAFVLESSEHSLLGQDFLRRFRSVAIEGDRMMLR